MLYPVFLVSGAAAILYQLLWQRALFTIYGTSAESVTVVVTAFMLGLGLGSLAGGRLSENSRLPLPAVFAALEIAIGAFGLVSLALFRFVGRLTSAAAGIEVGLWALGLVLLPTVLMGATLPLLVAHRVRESGNVGRSVGLLYGVNTLGSAIGSLAAALFLMGALGESLSVKFAAGLNFAVAVVVLATSACTRSRR